VEALTTAEQRVRQLAHRSHFRLSFWLGLALSVIPLALFVLLFNLAPDLGEEASPATLIGLGLLMSLAPALLWLGFFYRLDRLAPEPKRLVVNVFLLGALLTAALHGPVLHGLLQVDSWLYDRWWVRLLGGILIVGFFEQFLIYLVVRFGIYTHPEFDERVDGVIYGMAAGVGMATVFNFGYVLTRGGVDLDIGSLRIVVNALAYGTFGGVQGYFMGQARFETTPIYYLPAGLSLAALLNGLFFFLIERVGGGALSDQPWRDVIFAALVAGLTLGIVFWLVARATEETLRIAGSDAMAPGTAPSTSEEERAP
jgi:protease PrsW